MTMRFGSIIIHKPDPNSDGNHSSSDDAEVAEVAETAVQKYSLRTKREGQQRRKRSERQRRTAGKVNQHTMMRSRSSSTTSSSSNEVPVLRGFASDKSPPLNRSHYSIPSAATTITEDRLQTKKSTISSIPPVRRPSSSASDDLIINEERLLGFRVLTSGSRPTDFHQRRVSSVSFDSGLKTNSHTKAHLCAPLRESPFDENEEDSPLTGLTKLLKNLNFAERLRQQKIEEQRLDIQKLPNHMREQLKHIYVY